MDFKVGDTVRFLREVGSGKILVIKTKTALLVDENGFEMEYPLSQLVPTMKILDDLLLDKIENQTKIHLSNKTSNSLPEKKSEKVWKLDLHIENLIDNNRNLTNHEILTIQMNNLKKFLKSTEELRINKIIIVHGVGTGKLKSEVSQFVKNIIGSEIYDADFSQYGQGASVVERKYNIR